MNKQEEEDYRIEPMVTKVYLPDEDVYGEIIKHGIWSSKVKFYIQGIGYEEEVMNEDFIVIEEFGIEYEEGDSL